MATTEQKIKKLDEYLSQALTSAWSDNVNKIRLLLLKVLSSGEPLDSRQVSTVIETIRRIQDNAIASYATAKYGLINGSINVDLEPLKALLLEKEQMRGKILEGYKEAIKKDGSDLLALTSNPDYLAFLDKFKIGRRYPDGVRRISLDILEKSYLKGETTILTRNNILKEFSTFQGYDRQAGTVQILLYPYNDPSKVRNFNAINYAELVAQTTGNEITTVANIEKAKAMGTPFVKYNYRGKKYKQDGDHLCAKIDGKVFSVEKEVQQGGKWGAIGESGKFYEYLFDILRYPFLTAHPYCRHTPRPIARGMV